MKEFLFLYRAEGRTGSPEQMQQQMQKWMAWMKDLGEKGHIKDHGQPLDLAGKVVGPSAVTDGPYAETKDLILGYTLILANDLDQAAELAGGCPIVVGAGGVVEVRPVLAMNM